MFQPKVRVREDLPAIWKGATALFDPEDPRLRLRAKSLTQLARTDRDAVLAVYGFVKRIPFAKPGKLRLRTAREVLARPRADAVDKATLIVALLRAAGYAARLNYIELHGDILRGLTDSIASAGRPVLQVWLDNHWRSTDTYIFDAQYLGAARAELARNGWDWGFGIHRMGESLWNGRNDALLTGDLATTSGISAGSMGHFHDPHDFTRSVAFRDRYAGVGRAVRWHVVAPQMNRAVRKLREAPPPGPPPSPGPVDPSSP